MNLFSLLVSFVGEELKKKKNLQENVKILCRQLFPFQPRGHWNQTDKNVIGIG